MTDFLRERKLAHFLTEQVVSKVRDLVQKSANMKHLKTFSLAILLISSKGTPGRISAYYFR